MTELNFSRNQQIALIALVGISLLGLSYGRIRSSKPAVVKESSVTVSESVPGESVDIQGPSGRIYQGRGELPTVVVHVAGCVKNPSVYKLQPGSRVVDAIHMAGGPTRDANLDAVNLAEKVRDGEKIMVPSKQPAVTIPPGPMTAARTTVPVAAVAGVQSGAVNINTAGLAELDNLPGVGPATAQKIIDYRNQIGRFAAVDQLLDVKGIGPKKLEEMRPHVVL